MIKVQPLASLATFKEMYACDPGAQQHLRLGQHFCNLYIDAPWPALYYEADDAVAELLIAKWLRDNQYVDALPTRLNRIQLPH